MTNRCVTQGTIAGGVQYATALVRRRGGYISLKVRHPRADFATTEHPTLGIQPPTSNRVRGNAPLGVGRWKFDVGCFSALRFRLRRTADTPPVRGSALATSQRSVSSPPSGERIKVRGTPALTNRLVVFKTVKEEHAVNLPSLRDFTSHETPPSHSGGPVPHSRTLANR